MTEAEKEGSRQERKQVIADSLARLAQKREEGLIDPENFPPEGICYIDQEGRPLVRNDLRNQAIVLSKEQLDQLGFVSFISPSGETVDIFAEDTGYDSEDVLVIFPDELGEVGEPVLQVVEYAKSIVSGEYRSLFLDQDSVSPPDAFSGPILDLNDEALTLVDRVFLLAWIEGQLGASLKEASVSSRLISPDRETEVVIFETVLGQENDPWHFSQWQNIGEEPSYIFWPQEMYDTLEESGYETIPLE